MMIKLKKLNNNIAKIPVYPGCKFLHFALVKVKDIKTKFQKTDKDWGSVKGIIINIRNILSETLEQIKTAILEKNYDTKDFEPPMVSQSLELYTGRHRYTAHLETNETYIIVAVVVFEGFENKPAIHWLRNAQGLENNKPIFKNQGTDEDTIHIVLTQIKEKSITSSNEDIENSLKYQGIRNGLKRKQLINKINKRLKNKSFIEIPEHVGQAEKKIWFEKTYPHAKLSTSKNVISNDDNIIYITGEYKNKTDRYPIMNPFKIFKILSENPQKELVFAYSINADNAKHVKIMRKFVDENLSEFEKIICKMSDYIKSPNYKRPKQIPISQLKEDIK